MEPNEFIVNETWICANCNYMAIGVVCTKCGTLDPRYVEQFEETRRLHDRRMRIEGFLFGVVTMAALSGAINVAVWWSNQ